jgi:hypothetical protein
MTDLQVLDQIIERETDPVIVEEAKRRRAALLVDRELQVNRVTLEQQERQRRMAEDERRRQALIRSQVDLVHDGVHDTESRRPLPERAPIVESDDLPPGVHDPYAAAERHAPAATRVDPVLDVEIPEQSRRGASPEELAKFGVDLDELEQIVSERQAAQEGGDA